MDEILASSQYLARGDLTTVKQAIIECLFGNNIPHLIKDNEERDSSQKHSGRIRLFAPLWSAVGYIKLEPIDSTQTLVRFCLPGYPDEAEAEKYEQEIRTALPPPAVAIRLIDIEGDRPRALAYLGRQLHHFRLQRLREIQSLLVNRLGFLSLYGLQIERNRYPKADEACPKRQPDKGRNAAWDIPKEKVLLRDDQQKLVRMWQSGHTAKEIALRTSRTEKTILNQITLLRKKFGEELVPRRR